MFLISNGIKIPVQSPKRKPFIDVRGILGWGTIHYWSILSSLQEDVLLLLLGEKNLKQLLTIIPGGLVSKYNRLYQVSKPLRVIRERWVL